MRSLLTLKALTYAQTGGIVAAPTTSLPEQLGGTLQLGLSILLAARRDLLTLLALMDGGYFQEAEAWRDWLLRAAAGSPAQLQIMYGLGGERFLREWDIEWLPGYEDSKPVRIGNAAHGQIQIDVYGEVMDALYQARRGGISESADSWHLQKALTAHLSSIWHQPDQGIWETRGKPQHFTHSKVMAWVAIDRRDQEPRSSSVSRVRWTKWPRRAKRDSTTRCAARRSDPELGTFVQAYGSKLLDAGLLLMPLVGFLPADDPRVRNTIEAIEKHLVADGFVLRYDESRHGRRASRAALRARSSPCKPSGSRMTWCCSDGRMTRRACSQRLARTAQRCRPAVGGIRSGAGAADRQFSRKAFPTSPCSAPRTTLPARIVRRVPRPWSSGRMARTRITSESATDLRGADAPHV